MIYNYIVYIIPKYITNIDKRQLFNCKIMCIKDTNCKINTDKLIERFYNQKHHLFEYNT